MSEYDERDWIRDGEERFNSEHELPKILRDKYSGARKDKKPSSKRQANTTQYNGAFRPESRLARRDKIRRQRRRDKLNKKLGLDGSRGVKRNAQQNTKTEVNIADLSSVEKLLKAVEASAKYLPGEVAEEIKAIFTPATLATIVGVLGVYIAAHATGIGQAFDIGMLIAGGIFFGLDAFSIFKDIAGFANAINATTEEELEEAGEHLASAIAKIGVDAVMTLLTKKVADEVGKSIDNVNQVDEVRTHSDSAGNLDNANNSNADRTSDLDNVNNTTTNQNITNTPAQQLINAGYNPVAVNTLLPVLGLDGIERLHKMDMFSFAPERMNLINSGYGQTVRNLPDLKDRPRVEIEGILDNAGFDRPTVGTTGGQEMWLHPDGSVVRMKLGPQALKDTRRSTEHLVREISRKQPASSKNRDIFAKVSEDGTLIPAGPKFAKDQLQQWFKKETGKLPNSDELDELLRVWADAGHINFQP